MIQIVGIIALLYGGWRFYCQPESLLGLAGVLIFCGLALALLPARSNRRYR